MQECRSKRLGVGVLLLLVLLGSLGCDRIKTNDANRTLRSELVPFGVGGLALGMQKNVLESEHKLTSCSPAATNRAQCFIDDDITHYDFFGGKVDLLSTDLFEPYDRVASISFSLIGPQPSQFALESAWSLNGRCISNFDVELALDFDRANVASFVGFLNELHLLPGSGGFVCVRDDGAFFKYQNTSSTSNEGNVRLAYLDEIWVRNFGYIFRALEQYRTQKVALNTQFEPNRITTGDQHFRCTDFKSGISIEVEEERMGELARYVGRKDGYADRYFRGFVHALCETDIRSAESYVERADIPYLEANRIVQAFGHSQQFAPPPSASITFQQVKHRLISELGMCQACAASPALYFAHAPKTRCGRLVAQALAGTEVSRAELQSSPEYCKHYGDDLATGNAHNRASANH